MKMLLLTIAGVGILMLPNWKPPYSYMEYVIQLIGWILMIGPGFLTLAAFVNHMLNVSLSNNPKDRFDD